MTLRDRPGALPWPALIVAGFGAWLAALPLALGLVAWLGMSVHSHAGPGVAVIGLLLALVAVLLLRWQQSGPFLHHFAAPLLLTGLLCVALYLFSSQSTAVACGGLALLAGVVAALVPQRWLRLLLGLAAATLLFLAATDGRSTARHALFHWIVAEALLLAWLALQSLHAATAADFGLRDSIMRLQSFADGWCLALLFLLCQLSGNTVIVGAAAPGHGAQSALGYALPLDELRVLQAISAAAVLPATLWLRYRWASLRGASEIGVAVVIALLAWFMPALGAVVLAATAAAAEDRRWLAGAAVVAAAWIVGSLYFQLHLSLTAKALLLGLCAAALCVIGLLRRRAGLAQALDRYAQGALAPRQWLLLGAGIAAVLLFANVTLRRNEQLIRSGRVLYLPLQAVDPRSPLQGDYLAVSFIDNVNGPPTGTDHAQAVMKTGSDDITRVLRLHAGEALADGEFLLDLTRKRQRWVLVTDAWYFREGDAEFWSQARYGEFRYGGDGRILLVGLADEKRRRLVPQ